MTHHAFIAVNPLNKTPETVADYSPLLLLPFAAIAAYHFSKKQMRKAKNKMMWQLMKLKLKSMFSFKGKNGKGSSLLAIVLLISLALGILGVIIWNFGLGLLIFAASMVFSAIYIFLFNPLHKEY
jgi:uncharacterized membrane protein